MACRQHVGVNDFSGHEFGEGRGPFAAKVELEGPVDLGAAVEQPRFGKGLPDGVGQGGAVGDAAAVQGFGKACLPGSHHRRAAAQYLPPPGRLEGVDQLVFGHPLLAGQLVLLAEEVPGVVLAQFRQGRPLGAFQLEHGAFQGQPGQIVQHGLAPVLCPGPEQGPGHLLPKPLADTAHNAVHVQVGAAILLQGQEQRVKAVGPGGIPDLIQRPALLGAVVLGQHGAHPSNRSAPDSFWGIRWAITSRISPCS